MTDEFNDLRAAPTITITGEYQTVYESHDCRVSLAVMSGRLLIVVEDQRQGDLDGRPFFAHASNQNFAIGTNDEVVSMLMAHGLWMTEPEFPITHRIDELNRVLELTTETLARRSNEMADLAARLEKVEEQHHIDADAFKKAIALLELCEDGTG